MLFSKSANVSNRFLTLLVNTLQFLESTNQQLHNYATIYLDCTILIKYLAWWLTLYGYKFYELTMDYDNIMLRVT